MKTSEPKTAPLTYRDAGVDIDRGNALVDRIKPLAALTRRPEVLSGLGGFGGLFAVPAGYREPVLVAATDGVGTKLKLAQQTGRHAEVGIDLVAMCVNDVVVTGAEPLFFLDYFATGRLDNDVAEAVISGIANGCEQAGCALIGGETAEMPGMYPDGEYDLAGFSVGAVERERVLDGSRVRGGDVVLGLAASGPHANGFSLIRKIIETRRVDLDATFEGRPLVESLLAPTTIYVAAALELQRELSVHAFAHVTGGGLEENVIRVVPAGLGIDLDPKAWPRPAIFDWLQREGRVAPDEMLRTFNCGIGFCVVLAPADVDGAARLCRARGINAWAIGRVRAAGDGRVRFQTD